MSPKKLYNSADAAVSECVSGAVWGNPDLAGLRGHPGVLIRSDIADPKLNGKVAVVCGGGSGHEPGFGGYVGKGMLSAAVAGAVFASPPAAEVLATIKAVWQNAKPSGILLIVTNYTGDRINFGLAVERAKASGILCEMVFVSDDCAVTSRDRSAGRRGLCGTVLAIKAAGAMADRGEGLAETADYLNRHLLSGDCMATIGLALSSCSPPGRGPLFTLGDDEMELGLGVHGEAGVRRMRLTSASEAVRLMGLGQH